MKRYLLQISLITIVFICIVLGVFIWTYKHLYNSSFRVQESKNILILGDSHTEAAINDSILHRSKNVSLSGTPYPFSYIIAERVLDENPQIDTLLLSFHAISASSYLDRRWLTGDQLDVKIKNFTLFSNLRDILLTKNIDNYIAALKAPSWQLFMNKSKLLNPNISAFDLNIGRYNPLEYSKLSEDLDRRLDGFSEQSAIDTASIQFRYLKKIEQLCSEKGVKLILFNSPIYKVDKYTERAKFDNLRKEFLSKLTYLDFSDFPLGDSCYADVTHLNYKGAYIFSKYLQDKGFQIKYE